MHKIFIKLNNPDDYDLADLPMSAIRKGTQYSVVFFRQSEDYPGTIEAPVDDVDGFAPIEVLDHIKAGLQEGMVDLFRLRIPASSISAVWME